jgi:restriction system protein
MVRRPRRAIVKITGRGRDVLAGHPDRVDVGVLLQFEEFIEFRSRTRGDAASADADRHELAVPAETTPGETISKAVAEANNAVAVAVICRIVRRLWLLVWLCFEAFKIAFGL